MTRSQHWNNKRGGTLVEMAFALPLLLTVVFGIFECGRLVMAYTTVADAARAGTRYAIVHGSDRTGSGADGPSGPGNTGNVTSAAGNVMEAAGITAGAFTVTVAYPNGSNEIGAPVSVAVSYPFDSGIPLAPLTVTLGSTSEGTICY
jgi:Flp pilus assembly protein TadG